MIKILNNDFLKILNIKNIDSFEFFKNKYIINLSILELAEHLTNGLGSVDEINREIFRLIKDNKDFFYNKLKTEVYNPDSYFYMDKDTLDRLDYSFSSQGMMYFVSSTKEDSIKMFLNLFFIYWDNVLEIYDYTNEKLEEESFTFTKKEYDSIFINEFLDNLENIAILK